MEHRDRSIINAHQSAVCRIHRVFESPQGKVVERGTGFLVLFQSIRCILTNAHVISSREAAEACEVFFLDHDGKNTKFSNSARLCPSARFLSSPRPKPAGCTCNSKAGTLSDVCTCREAANCNRQGVSLLGINRSILDAVRSIRTTMNKNDYTGKFAGSTSTTLSAPSRAMLCSKTGRPSACPRAVSV
jgi:hypothetical protein